MLWHVNVGAPCIDRNQSTRHNHIA